MRITIDEDTYIRAVAALQRSSEIEDREAAQKMREASQRYNESITDKKRAATQKASQKRAETAQKKIIKAINDLRKKDAKINITNIANKAKVSQNTVRKYRHLIDTTY